MMRRGLLLLMSVVMIAAMSVGLAACGTPASSEEPKSDALVAGSGGSSGSSSDMTSGGTDAQSDKRGVAINLSDNSILTFDGDPASAKLVDDMRAGRIPASCTVLYDQMGALPTVTVTDARTIRDVYKRLARMHVEGESNMSITDSYHLVSFELQDGTTATYRFEGSDILVRGSKNYAVSDRSDLWSYVRYLQEQYLREQSAGDDFLDIELEDDEELVLQCPTSAPVGEVVQVLVPSMADASLYVAVNGDKDFGEFVSENVYEFVMPDAPVTVHVWSSTAGYPGA